MATPIEISSNTTDPAIPVGKCPVYAVQTTDQQRLFVLNRGDDTITVINTRNNTLDACTPFQNQNGQWVHAAIQHHPASPTGSGPIYAEYTATQQLVVANYDGGTISVIDVRLDEYGNDSNTYANSNCTTSACGAITGGFGTFTVPVGNTATPNPASVTVLYDGSKAYTANQNDGAQNGTVTVVNLSTHTVEKTLTVVGHPRTVVNTQNSEFTKIYVASPDSPTSPSSSPAPTVTDLIDTTVLVEGTWWICARRPRTAPAATTITAAAFPATASHATCRLRAWFPATVRTIPSRNARPFRRASILSLQSKGSFPRGNGPSIF